MLGSLLRSYGCPTAVWGSILYKLTAPKSPGLGSCAGRGRAPWCLMASNRRRLSRSFSERGSDEKTCNVQSCKAQGGNGKRAGPLKSLEFEGIQVLGPWSSLLPAPKMCWTNLPAQLTSLLTWGWSQFQSQRDSDPHSMFLSSLQDGHYEHHFFCPDADLGRSRSESCMHHRHPRLHALFCSDLVLCTHGGCEGFRSQETSPCS